MTRCTIRNCRSMVRELKPFHASTLTGAWENADDGTRLYVVTSQMKRAGYGPSFCTLFVCCDGKWYECRNLDCVSHHYKRSQQMYYARPLLPHKMIRLERFALSRFAKHGLAYHPDMTRLLNVSV